MNKSEIHEDNEEFDFEKDLSINKYRLDEECLSHSSLYFKYAEAQQEAKNRVSRAKNNLELVQSERNLAIREELTKKGTKYTESMVDKLVAADELVIKAKNKLFNVESVYAKLSVAVQAFEHRKSELDNLVKLYCSGYYSLPTNGGTGVRKSVNDQTSREMRKKLNNKESEND
ncbi:hypothetical protein [Methanobrevibacter sp.]|uniref:hypothetical protein n=1 Tax=Methanobrevibacter sp. TaxID=66852 RepID=UPI00386A62A0